MTTSRSHRLEGLEPDNLLAFLALLGLLRSLEAVGLRPRAHWEGLPLRPVLDLPEPVTQETVAEQAAAGCARLAQDHDFCGEKDLTFRAERARYLLEHALQRPRSGRAELLGCLFSDGAVDQNNKIIPTPLCAMFGQGHQHFLARLASVPRGDLPTSLQKRRPPPDLKSPDFLVEALFHPWQRRDETDGFRWDPAEDRRYALRFRDPSKEAGRTVHGANRLAAVGIAAMPGTAVMRPRGVRFLNIGTELGEGGGIVVTWPIWARPASLAAIRALLAHPALLAAEPAVLERLGVIERRRARRILNGRFVNFTRAEVV